MTLKELKILLDLYQAYCEAMRSKYDFPGDPWTPHAHPEIIAARDLLAKKGIKLS